MPLIMNNIVFVGPSRCRALPKFIIKPVRYRHFISFSYGGPCIVIPCLGIIHAANPDPVHLHRPLIRVVTAPEGGRLASPPIVNLAETRTDGKFARTVIKVTDPAKYGINPADYFV